MNIIIVEDDSLTALFLQESVEDLGHTVLGTFDSAKPLLEKVNNMNVDLAFMDIEINGKMDGIECAAILQNKYSISSIFITSYQNSSTINDAMDSSPLGYLIKPVSETEIEACLAVASRTLKKSPPKIVNDIQIGDYIYTFESKTLTLNNELIKLSKNEYKVIDILCNSYGNVVETQELVQSIWQESENRTDSLRELIYRLRKKLPSININSLSKSGYYIQKKTDT